MSALKGGGDIKASLMNTVATANPEFLKVTIYLEL
jgi:hypothetical protein